MTGLLGLESLATHAAGLRMKTDVEQGYWFSISNRPLLGVTGVEIGLTARADDPQSETNRLNEKGITTVFNSYGTGYRMWGIRLRDLIKGVPSKVDVKGYDPKSKQTVSASRSSKSRRGKAKHGSTGDTLRIVPNKGESTAQLNARADAKLADAQDTAFSGKTVHQHFGTTTTSKAWDASQIRAKLTAARNRLSGVFIENEPWERCFKRYDREHTFFYADPPYWQTAGYDRAFDWAQYQLLAKVMSESKGKIMLSINDHPDIRNLFKDFRIAQFELAYSIGRSKTGKTSGELAICNW